MKILILGAGAVGGYFGGLMTVAGAEVTFLVRPRRHMQLQARGLVLKSSIHGGLEIPVAATCEVTHTYDLVLLACKAYHLVDAVKAIAPAVGSNCLILPVLNGLRHLEFLDSIFGIRRVAGGSAHIGAKLDKNGEVVHLNTLQYLTFGARDSAQIERCTEFHAVASGSRFDAIFSPCIMQEMWEKFVYLTTYAGITCLMRSSIGAISSNSIGHGLILEFLNDCALIARAFGYAPRLEFLEQCKKKLTDVNSDGTSSMFRDLLQCSPTEADHVLNDMWERSKIAGISSSILRTACAHLAIYESNLRSAMVAQRSTPIGYRGCTE